MFQRGLSDEALEEFLAERSEDDEDVEDVEKRCADRTSALVNL